MNTDSLKQILTLRYDTTLDTTLPKLGWKDFFKKNDVQEDDFSIIENSIKDSISEYLNNAGDATISLSSGIDSTLVGTILGKNFPDVKVNSLSLTFSNSFDESPAAKKIADELNFNHHVVHIENFLEEIPKAISIVEKPFWDLHWYYIVKEATKYSCNFLSGDGGDELFGGYVFRYKKYLSLVSEKSSTLEKIKAYLACHERDWIEEQELIFSEKTSFKWREIYSILEKFFNNELELLDQVFLADYNGKLSYNMTPIYKKIHENFNLSYNAPILNKDLLNFSSHLDYKEKYDLRTNQGKIPLTRLCEKYGMNNFISKEKKGFSIDTKNLWEDYGKKICEYFLTDARTIRDGWIRNDWIKRSISRDDLDYRDVNKFLGLLALEIWYRLFITKEMSPNEKLNF